MHARLFTFAVVALSMCAARCDGSSNAGLTTRLVGPNSLHPRLVSVEPATLRPEFLTGAPCRGFRPFRTRFNLFVHAERDLVLRGVRFHFDDRAGGRAHPLPIPTTVTAPTIPNSVPLALPTSAPIPIPGTLTFHGVMVSSGVNAMGLAVHFDCGVPAEGTLSISVETTDGEGARDVSRVAVRVG